MEFGKEENNHHHHLQYSDTREEEEEEGEEEEVELFQDQSRMINKVINPTTSYSHHHLQQQQQLPLLSSSLGSPSSSSSAAAKKWMSNMSNEGAAAELFLPDMSSRMSWGGGGGGGEREREREREHMFDKVVTPSDVGKLNRLVIPKQHAEKYFPLDPTSTDKGLLLNFEDRTGKCWRFRYSYWNSSQSYVMTKGWSRFVKEKKLDAGDIVSFHRSSSSSNSSSAAASLFIDWRRRPTHHHYPNADHHYHHHNQNHNLHHHPYYQHYQRWGYSLPQSPALPPAGHEIGATSFNRRDYPASSINNHGNYYYYGQHVGVLRPPILFESVPVTVAAAPVAQPKRLRLFGVNMECSPSQEDGNDYRHRHQISSSHHNQVRLQNNNNNNNSITSQLFPFLPTTTTPPTSTSGSSFPEFSQKGKSSATSLSFDLDP